jgi:hypothetical protein
MSEERGTTGIERRLRLCALLVLAGVVVELVSLQWSHPAAFLLFAIAGGALTGAGVLLYLYSLVAKAEAQTAPARTSRTL